VYCEDEEDVLRALRENEFDKKRVLSPHALKDKALSVSRLTIYPMTKIFAIFHRDFDRGSPVVAALKLNVGEITRKSGENIENLRERERKGKIPLKVHIDPLVENEHHPSVGGIVTRGMANESHAFVEGNVTRGMAKSLIAMGVVHREHGLVRFFYWIVRTFGLTTIVGSLTNPKKKI